MSVSTVVVRALVEAVEGSGLGGSKFLKDAGFDATRLANPNERLEQAEYDTLVERALDFTGDPALGLRMALATKSLTYSLPGHLVFQAASFREGLSSGARYHRLLVDDLPYVLEEHANEIVIKITGVKGSVRCRRFGAEVAVAGLYRAFRHFVAHARPEFVAFEHPAPAHRAEYARVFDGLERFEQSFTGMVVDRKLMEAPQLHFDDGLHAILQSHATKRVAELEDGSSYGEKVRDYVAAMPGRAHDMHSVARALGTSSRTLRRRLLEEGVTFRQVVEKALASVATRLLVEERKSIQEASYEMSFSDASAFCRAFKRWTGSTPREYQSAHGRRAAHSRR
jgi:AraC-like DNA-binding protein